MSTFLFSRISAISSKLHHLDTVYFKPHKMTFNLENENMLTIEEVSSDFILWCLCVFRQLMHLWNICVIDCNYMIYTCNASQAMREREPNSCMFYSCLCQMHMFIKQCMTFALTFLNSLSTSVASSIFLSRRSFWISRIQATRLTYGLWLALLSTPGSLSDLSIRDVNKKSPLRSLSPVLSRCFRRLLEKFSLSRLFCRLSLEPMIAVTLKTQC